MKTYEQTVQQLAPGQRFALLTIIRTQGSTARKCGAALTCSTQGEILAGTIGGGQVEQKCLHKAQKAITSSLAEIASFNQEESLQDRSPQSLLQLCGGCQEIFINGRAFHFLDAIEQAIALQKARKPGILLTIIKHHNLDSGAIRCVAEDEFMSNQLPAAPKILADCLAGHSTLLHEDERGNRFLLEPIVAPKRLLVIGGGHCGKAVAELGLWLNYQVTIIDSRPPVEDEWPQGRSISWICGNYDKEIHAFAIDASTSVVIMTQGHDTDALALQACLQYPCGYLGMIGSRKKIDAMRKHFLGKGVITEEQWQKIHAPIGLHIGAETVKEIALSVLAQMVSLERTTASADSSSFRCF